MDFTTLTDALGTGLASASGLLNALKTSPATTPTVAAATASASTTKYLLYGGVALALVVVGFLFLRRRE